MQFESNNDLVENKVDLEDGVPEVIELVPNPRRVKKLPKLEKTTVDDKSLENLG
jgi:hypothetical protein